MGRFLALGPDKKTTWIQVGKTSARVGRNQIRQAVGWESWTPSQDDIQIRKNAEGNMLDNLWENAVEQQPLDDSIDIDHAQPAQPDQEQTAPQDYWTYTDTTATRHHLQPRYNLYTPQQHECDFDVNQLEYIRYTHNLTHISTIHHSRTIGMKPAAPPSATKHGLAQQPFTGTYLLHKSNYQPNNIYHHHQCQKQHQINHQDSQYQPYQYTTSRQHRHNNTQFAADIRQQIQQSEQQCNVDNRQITVNIDSPTYQQFGPNYAPVPPTS